MQAKALTDRFIRSLKPQPGVRLQFMDSEARGLALRMTPGGALSWSFVYRPRGLTKSEAQHDRRLSGVVARGGARQGA